MKNDFKILRINAIDTRKIRKKVLYKNSSTPDDLIFEDDEEESTFHLGGFHGNKLVSVVSFFMEKHPDLKGENHFRLRGMATIPSFRGHGLSKLLLKSAFPIIQQNQCTLIWCRTREEYISFLSKHGFKPFSEPFEIEGLGGHINMVLNF